MRLVFDVETDGLLPELTKVHSIVIRDVDTGEGYSCTDHEYEPDGDYVKLTIEDGLLMLMRADLVIGHNIIAFDIKALKKVYPWFDIDRSKVFDTLVMSMLIWTNLYERDMKKVNSGSDIPKKLRGRHSLEAWGYRLDSYKVDYSGGFDEWSVDMQEYCEIDVEVTRLLWKLIDRKNYSPTAIEIEHRVKFICVEQEAYGFDFDVDGAEELTKTLQKRRVELEEELQETFKPWFSYEGEFIPKRPNKRLGYDGVWVDTGKVDDKGKPIKEFKGNVCTKIKYTTFNPGSNHHIENRLRKLRGWKPKKFTPNGQAQIDESVLAELPWPEAKLLAEYKLVQKRLGQIAEGNKAWLKVVGKDGRIHGGVVTNGTPTGRATHKDPNISQVPSTGAIYGHECRACFTASPGRVLVGVDMSGLELRMLGHYMAKFDGGEFAKIVVEGDVHWVNVQALGLVSKDTERDEDTHPTHKLYRDTAKRFIYAFLYGAGGLKIALTLMEFATDEKNKGLGDSISRKFFSGKSRPGNRQMVKVGNDLKKSFLNRTPALKKLINGVKAGFKRDGHLVGLDGRLLHVRSEHSALNTLLQSAGSIACKRWMVELDAEIERRNWRPYVHQVAWSHDELQFDCDPEILEEFKEVAVDCISRAGEALGVRLPLTGEAKSGPNWAETH